MQKEGAKRGYYCTVRCRRYRRVQQTAGLGRACLPGVIPQAFVLKKSRVRMGWGHDPTSRRIHDAAVALCCAFLGSWCYVDFNSDVPVLRLPQGPYLVRTYHINRVPILWLTPAPCATRILVEIITPRKTTKHAIGSTRSFRLFPHRVCTNSISGKNTAAVYNTLLRPCSFTTASIRGLIFCLAGFTPREESG